MAANFDGLKQKTEVAAEFVAAKSVQFAHFAAEKARVLAKSAKLNTEILSEKDAIRHAQLELGKLYYEAHRQDPEEPFADVCRRISASLERIREKREQLEALKRGEDISDAAGKTALLQTPVQPDDAQTDDKEA